MADTLVTLSIDSTVLQARDGHITPGGTFVSDGAAVDLEWNTGVGGKAWFLFEHQIDKYRRCGTGYDPLLKRWTATNLGAVLTLMPSEDITQNMTLTIRAELARNPEAPSSTSDLNGRTLTSKSVAWNLTPGGVTVGVPLESPDLADVINEVLESFPADGRAANLLLHIEVTDAAGDTTLGVESGESDDVPALELRTHSILNIWRGDAIDQQAVIHITVNDAVPNALYRIEFLEGPAVYRALSDDTTEDIAVALAEAITALNIGEVEQEGSVITITSAEAGQPIAYTLPLLPASYVESLQDGRAPTPQRTTVTLPSKTTGGTWDLTFDFGSGDETVAAIAWNIDPDTLKTSIAALATPVAGDVLVELLAPRVYRFTFTQNLAGEEVDVSADGSDLTGNATATVEVVQEPRSQIKDVHAIWIKRGTVWTQNIEISLDGTEIALRPDAGSDAWTAAAEAHYGEGNVVVHNAIAANVGILVFVFLQAEAGVSHTVTVANAANYEVTYQRLQNAAGADSSNEFVVLSQRYVGASLGLQQYTLDFGAETTANIDYDDPETIASTLEALTAIGVGDVTVHRSPYETINPNPGFYGLIQVVEFVESLAGADVDNLIPKQAVPTGTDVTPYGSISGGLTGNDVQVVMWDGDTPEIYLDLGGGYSLSFNMTFDETDIQNAFNIEIGSGEANITLLDTLITGGQFAPRSYTRFLVVEYTGSRAGAVQPTIDPSVGETMRLQDPADADREWQWLDLRGLQFQDIGYGGQVIPSWDKLEGTGYKLSMDALETEMLTFGDFDAIDPALEAIISGDVIIRRFTTAVDSIVPWVYFLGFTEAQSQLTISEWSTIGAAVIDGSPLLNEIQRITVNATGGTLTAELPGGLGESSAMAFPASAATWDATIEETAGAGDVSCVGLGSPESPLLVEFIDDLALTDVALLIIDTANLTGGAVIVVTEVTAPIAGQNEIWRVNRDPFAIGGSLRLALEQGLFGPPIAWDADDADVGTALNTTPGFGAGQHAVSGAVGGPWIIEAIGTLAFQQLPVLQIDQRDLDISDSEVLTIESDVEGTGSNWFREPLNWSLRRPPASHDVLVFEDGRTDCLYGVEMVAEAAVHPTVTSALHLSAPSDFVPGQIVRLVNQGGSLPQPASPTLTEFTDLYVISHDVVAQTLQLALTRNGTPIVWSTAGSGRNFVCVRLRHLRSHAAYSGKVGRGLRDIDGRYEDGSRYLHVGFLDPVANTPNCEMGIGDGSGSPLFHIDAGPTLLDLLVISTGGATGKLPACNAKCEHEEFRLTVLAGECGLAPMEGDFSVFKLLRVFGGSLQLGNNVKPSEEAVIETYGGGRLLGGEIVSGRATIRNRGV